MIVNGCATCGAFHVGRTHSGCEARKGAVKTDVLHG
jgi:hypothetical protein